jgi:hypothetical protein
MLYGNLKDKKQSQVSKDIYVLVKVLYTYKILNNIYKIKIYKDLY